ncbi:unnamed protein product [Brachionus calyciflorus]|uniref:Uncharacterized protein n=1 Tax=Brachionus calyciflorus TaxID=104777 RepID=A0A814Q0A5_9BILA|nr:unnamed protein product [Brachionus calyciflorus]
MIIKKLSLKTEADYEEVKLTLTELLAGKINGIELRDTTQILEDFINCVKHSSESVNESLERFKELAASAEIIKLPTLISFFIKNLKDEEMEKFVRQNMVVSYAKSYEASLNKNNQANQLQEVLVAQSISNQINEFGEQNSLENYLKPSITKPNSQVNHKQNPNHQDHNKNSSKGWNFVHN